MVLEHDGGVADIVADTDVFAEDFIGQVLIEERDDVARGVEDAAGLGFEVEGDEWPGWLSDSIRLFTVVRETLGIYA